jgi:Tfp pilus assembly protein PilX
MFSVPRPAQGERGIALVVALLVLVVISVLSLALLASVNVETKLSGHGLRQSQALNIAEAGVGEAIAQIRKGNVPTVATNPKMVSQIYLAAAGSVPAVGVDTTAIPTAQPNGGWMTYSTATKTKNVLTVEYKTDPARTVIYKYDPSLSNPIQTVSGSPIYKITSTGQEGASVRRIVTEVMQKPMNMNIKGAMCTNVDIKFDGNAFACGYNHRADTPFDTGVNGRAGVGGCNENPGLNQWEVGSGNLTGIWSGGAINDGGASSDAGTPPTAAGQPGFYAGPWQALGMTQAAFFAWVGPAQATVPGSLDGVIYLDNDGVSQNQSGGWSAGGATGSGMLYVDGDFTMDSGFTYRGLIYVEGDVKLNGHAWILGALIVKGKTSVKFNGGATLLYSADAIAQNIAKSKADLITLSWREIAP